mmetsp:Transcript_42446/g.107116  ORF Transcript_42446/g.107116 Transcript_42446/m.107116 type:complete len:84 (-) Transcript_42446:2402-2653(-)
MRASSSSESSARPGSRGLCSLDTGGLARGGVDALAKAASFELASFGCERRRLATLSAMRDAQLAAAELTPQDVASASENSIEP